MVFLVESSFRRDNRGYRAWENYSRCLWAPASPAPPASRGECRKRRRRSLAAAPGIARQRLPSRATLDPPACVATASMTRLSTLGDTFHCRPSSVMTVTVFWL
jgi:hypothetical protein